MFKSDLGGLHPSVNDRVRSPFTVGKAVKQGEISNIYISKGMWSVSSIKRTQMLCHSILSAVLVKGRHHDAQFLLSRQRCTRAVSKSGADARLTFHHSNNQHVLDSSPLPTKMLGHWIRTKNIEVRVNLPNSNLAVQ